MSAYGNPITTTILNAIKARRTIYHLKPTLPAGITLDDVRSVVHTVIKDTPTTHNCQSNRAIIITGEAHRKIWAEVSARVDEGYPHGKRRPKSIRDEAYGCVYFFVDESVASVEDKKEKPQIARFLEDFDEQASGSAQVLAWIVLESLGFGAHLQHYNLFLKGLLPNDIPKTWTLKAQLVFGEPVQPPTEKQYVNNDIKLYN